MIRQRSSLSSSDGERAGVRVDREPAFASRMHWDHEPSVAFELPLPMGEGRGEGEGTVRQPIVFDPANRPLQPTVHGETPRNRATSIDDWTARPCFTQTNPSVAAA